MSRNRLFPSRILAVIACFAFAAIPGVSRVMATDTGIDFGGTNAYVGLGEPSPLHLPVFTVECWFRRDGAGITTSTGTGGLTTAVPLVSKGRGEADGSNKDMNFFLGIQGDRIAADFEEGAAGSSPGLNHPVTGVTPIVQGVWYHAAVTYDGTRWRLYLDGVLETELVVGQPPRADSIQLASIGSALTSTGAAAGFFDGVIDEVRVWDHARTGSEIAAAMSLAIPSSSGLVGRWGLEEGSGTTVSDSSGSGITGAITGTSYAWAPGAPSLSGNLPPLVPSPVSPADGALGVGIPAALEVGVSDPEDEDLTVTFYGRPEPQAADDFTIVALPDAQFYASTYPANYTAQTQWIVANRSALNITYVGGLGDITNDGDSAPTQWDNADAAYALLEDPATTGLADGIPFGATVGNHDQTPNGNPGTLGDDASTTVLYNQTFGAGRFQGRGYYGGHYGAGNDNHYDLFSASGMDFIVIYLEYDATATTLRADVLNWANGLLQTHAGRRGIIISHYILGPSGTFSSQGQAIYDALKGNPNLFLMLCGHLDQAARRSDNYAGNTVHSVLSDYQTQPNGGNGWLRYMTFRPSENRIDVYTYSPTLGQYMTDSSNQFSLDYTMAAAPFTVIDTAVGVPSGTTAGATWNGLDQGTRYEWYVTASDGVHTTTGPVWSFRTSQICTPAAQDDPTCDGMDDDCDGQFDEDYVPVAASCGNGICAATGMTYCAGGVVQSDCVPGPAEMPAALGLDGASGYVDFGNAAPITDFGTSSFTVEGWFKAHSATTSYHGIFRHGRQGAASQAVIQLAASSPYERITASVEDTAGHQVDVPPVPISLNQWHHVAVVVDRSGGELRLYLDGVLAGMADGTSWGANPITSADNVLLGAARLSTGATAYYFDGLLGEFRIWSGVRSVTEIQESMGRRISTAPGLLARWGLEEGTGSTAWDSAGTSHGTLTGGAGWAAESGIGVERLCDGLDNDCDGLTDEDYAMDATCGTGACRSSNTPSSCVGGVETPCSPGPPASDDVTCDAVDDDCDGLTDEEFLPFATACGVGVCGAAGQATCVGGAITDTCVPGKPGANYGIDFDGASEYVTFGPAPGLGAATFTLEAWFNRRGAGATANTGNGGVVAIPLITKGRGEAEGSNVDMNWFLGIRGSDGVLAADFEDFATGANHPVAGVTAVSYDVWHHAAATYDGSTWNLYLDGALEATLLVGQTPRHDSIQHAAIGTAMNSTGVASGWFDGLIDEARVWDVALSQGDILGGMGAIPSPVPGLVARYTFDEGTGTILHDSAGAPSEGLIVGGTWVAGTPFASLPAPARDHALDDAGGGYVTFGPAAALGSATFTIETWFNRQGAGIAANTGTGGFLGVPLLTKGRGEAEGSNVDMNWFLGIRESDNVLAADFEDMAAGTNHPVVGVTPIVNGRWYHAAATYDGSEWRLYLDGTLEATLVVGQTPRYDSIQHAALGTAMNSTGAAQGSFDGVLDEPRVWNVARTQAGIQADMSTALTVSPGLVARWGLDEGSGGVAHDSIASTDGTIVGAAWVDGYPFAGIVTAYDQNCNGLDDDCDGAVDEEYAPAATACGVGACGASGATSCVGGVEIDSCLPGLPAVEICDGVDNDCDGDTDDGNPGGGDECGPGDPVQCSFQVTRCVAGTLVCVGETGTAPEICRDLAFSDETTLTWSAMTGISSYAVYRGTILVPWIDTHVCLMASMPAAGAVDSDMPATGSIYYYMISGRNSCGQGILGYSSSGETRPNVDPCP